jgi:RNA polymerase sigma factor (sigma-70 family)
MLDHRTAELAAATRADLVRQGCRRGLSHAESEDAAQDALLALWIHRERIDPATARHWLAVVARHAGVRHWHARMDLAGELVHELPAPEPDHARTMDVRAALEALRPDERRALLCRMLGLSYAEIARQHGWTYTKVNRAVSEGRAALRAHVEVAHVEVAHVEVAS